MKPKQLNEPQPDCRILISIPIKCPKDGKPCDRKQNKCRFHNFLKALSGCPELIAVIFEKSFQFIKSEKEGKE